MIVTKQLLICKRNYVLYSITVLFLLPDLSNLLHKTVPRMYSLELIQSMTNSK